jgi:quinol---cytochrome-c reductase cytochrome c subunit
VIALRHVCLLGPFAVSLAGFAVVLSASPSAGQSGTGDAAQIYLRDCASCHGPGAAGTQDGPSLLGVGAALVDYELTTGRMPLPDPDAEVVRRPPTYDPETIDALVGHLARLGPGGPAVPEVDIAGADVARGGELFRLECAACHQAAGQGGALRYGEAPALRLSTPVQVAEAVRTGPGTMPIFGPEALDDDDVTDVAAYVTYLHDPDDPGGQPLWHFGPLAEGLLAFGVISVLTVSLTVVGQRRR